MPISIVRRAEEVLKHLETTKGSVATSAILTSNGLHVADGNGHYEVGPNLLRPRETMNGKLKKLAWLRKDWSRLLERHPTSMKLTCAP